MNGNGMYSSFPVQRAADLRADESFPWLVRGLWARGGVGLIGGAPKCLKTWLGLDLVVSISSGTPCVGTFPVEYSGSVLIYLAEDATPIVRARLDAISAHRGLDLAKLPIDVITAAGIRLDIQSDRMRLSSTIRERKPTLLLLDPFVRLHRIDENSAAEVSAILGSLRALQREHAVAIAIVHHAKKNAAPGASGYALRGSGDFYAWADTMLSLTRQRDRIVLRTEHRAAPPAEPRMLSLVDGISGPHLEVVAAAEPQTSSASPATLTENLDTAVLAALKNSPAPLLRLALRDVVRVRNASLGEALTRLLKAGRVKRIGDAWALI